MTQHRQRFSEILILHAESVGEGLGVQGSLGFRYKFLECIRLVDSKF